MLKLLSPLLLIGTFSMSGSTLANELPCETLVGASCSATMAAEININAVRDTQQHQLTDMFPAMDQRELDLLWFKISDTNSMRSIGD